MLLTRILLVAMAGIAIAACVTDSESSYEQSAAVVAPPPKPHPKPHPSYPPGIDIEAGVDLCLGCHGTSPRKPVQPLPDECASCHRLSPLDPHDPDDYPDQPKEPIELEPGGAEMPDYCLRCHTVKKPVEEDWTVRALNSLELVN